jgi:hypothetical protein
LVRQLIDAVVLERPDRRIEADHLSHTHPMRITKTAIIILVCMIMTACMGTRFVYERLDWLTTWYVSDIFDLDSGQKAEFREIADRNMEWHRENQLPRYAEFCRELDREMEGSITPEALERRYQEMLVIWDEFIVHIMPDASVFLRSLSDEQVEDFLANVEESNQELWDEYAGRTPEQRLSRREKSAIKGVQRFTGRLNGEQKDLVRSYIVTMHDNSEEWLDGRREWQAEFRDLMQSKPDEQEYIKRLTALMLDPNTGDSDEYRRKVDDNRRIIFEMFSALVDQLTEKQRKRVRKRLNSFAEDFEFLAGQV